MGLLLWWYIYAFLSKIQGWDIYVKCTQKHFLGEISGFLLTFCFKMSEI